MLRFVIVVAAAAGLALAGLGVVEVPAGRRAEAERSGFEAYSDQGDLLFVPLEAAGARGLQARGWPARVVDPDGAPGNWYMVPHTKLNPAGAPGRVLWDDVRRAVVRLDDGEALAAQAAGWLLVPLGRRARPVLPGADAAFSWSPDTAVERMVNMVSLDTLMADIRRLEGYGTRYSYSPKCESSGRWLADEFRALGWDVAIDTYRLQQPVTRAVNIEATRAGITRPDSIVVACGHYDSYTRQGMTSAPGADDNATGTAILLELARVLREYDFRWTIKLLAFSGEEQWMKGSYHWVDSIAVPQGMDIYGAFNVDMIGYTAYESTYLVVNRDVASQPMALLAESTNRWYDIGLSVLNYLDPDCAGDNTPFWEVGIKSTFALEDSEWGIWNGSNPHYHTTHDTAGNLRPGQVHRVAKLTAAGVAHVAGPAAPVGVQEPAGPDRPLPAAFVRSQFVLPGREAGSLFDIRGRRVMVLEPGLNDLSPLARGVYHLRGGDHARPVRRLILVD